MATVYFWKSSYSCINFSLSQTGLDTLDATASDLQDKTQLIKFTQIIKEGETHAHYGSTRAG